MTTIITTAICWIIGAGIGHAFSRCVWGVSRKRVEGLIAELRRERHRLECARRELDRRRCS